MPVSTQGFSTMPKSWCQFAAVTAPKSRIPRARQTSPQDAKTVTAARMRYLRKGTPKSLGVDRFYCFRVAGVGRGRRSNGYKTRLRFRAGFQETWLRLPACFLHCPIAGGAQLQERPGLFVQTLPIGRVEHGFPHNSEDCLRPEVIFVVKAVDHLQDVIAGDSRVLDHCDLVAHLVHHLGTLQLQEAVGFRVVVKFRSRVSVSKRYLNRFDVQLFGEIDGAADSPVGFAG